MLANKWDKFASVARPTRKTETLLLAVQRRR
jgi:hypothetical protein